MKPKAFKMGAPKTQHRPAFEGAHFDKQGFCLTHPQHQICLAIKGEGKVTYEEICRHCPSCESEKNNSKFLLSHGDDKHLRGSLRSHMSKQSSSRSKLSHSTLHRDTPFDEKGRCHYHKSVQLASKKIGGGWKVLRDSCPKCVEEGHGDDHSLSSRKSGGTTRSGDTTKGQFDRNGCCVLHRHVQVAKKKVLGGWKVVRACPVCSGEEDIGLDQDQMSVYSRKSTRSHGARSVKSSRSTKSYKSTKSHKSSKSTKSSRPYRPRKPLHTIPSHYTELPFDSDGYCCQHPNVLLAQKKLIGGWKIIHDICPQCASEAGVKLDSKPRRRSSFNRLKFDTASSVASSIRSGSTAMSSVRKKHIRVKNMRTQDENGDAGKYTGDVNEDYRPHGQGKMKYDDGTTYEGVWNEGSQVHGKTKGHRQGKLKRTQSRF